MCFSFFIFSVRVGQDEYHFIVVNADLGHLNRLVGGRTRAHSPVATDARTLGSLDLVAIFARGLLKEWKLANEIPVQICLRSVPDSSSTSVGLSVSCVFCKRATCLASENVEFRVEKLL